MIAWNQVFIYSKCPQSDIRGTLIFCCSKTLLQLAVLQFTLFFKLLYHLKDEDLNWRASDHLKETTPPATLNSEFNFYAGITG